MSAGAWPSLEMASVTPSRRSTPPRYAVAFGGSSTAFTKIRLAFAARDTARFTSGVAAATTSHTSSRSVSTNGRVAISTLPTPPASWGPSTPSVSNDTTGATTSTSAPAARNCASFDPATVPPPTSSTRRPLKLRNRGSSSVMRFTRAKSKKARRALAPGLSTVQVAESAVNQISDWSRPERERRGPKLGLPTDSDRIE